MPVTPALSYPGVYIQEIPSGVRTITGVATSIAAFIGRTLRGPTNDAVEISNFGDFERQFGGLDAAYPMSYALRDFFNNGGAQAIVVRIYTPFFATETDRNTALTAATSAAQAGADAVANAATTAAAAPGATPASTATAANGALASLTGPGLAAGKLVASAANKKAAEAGPPLPTPTDVANAATAAKVDAVKTAAGAAAPVNRAQLRLPPTGASGVVLEAAANGAWGNALQATVDFKTRKKDDGSDDPNLFNLAVREVLSDGSQGRAETFLNVSRHSGDARYVKRVLLQESSLVRVLGDPTDRPDEGTTKVQGNWQASDSKPLDEAAFKGEENKKTGLYALEKVDLFNLLCIPADTREGDTPKGVYSDALAYCVKRRAMLLVDPPHGWSANPDIAAATALAGLDSDIGLSGPFARNGAIFFPRLKEADSKRDGQVGEFVPCGAVAGIFARTDSTRGVWKAPAGMDASLNGVAGLTATLTDLENGRLNQRGINVLRTFPVYGHVVWGSRTLRGADQAADEYKYVPVRRTALFIEESLYRGTQWVVFEPNDEPLWAQIRLNIGAFMQNLFRQGAFQGKTPQEAYFVKCDKETTTQNDINLGIVNIIVGFAPLKPAEFVVIYLQQMAGQIQT